MRPAPVLRRRVVWSFALALAALTASACEPRIEEPVPPSRSAVTPEGPDSAKAAADEFGGRCVRRTPETPVRPVPPSPDPKCPPDPEGNLNVRMGKVAFKDAGGKAIEVEIAETEHARERGLMFRKSMDEGRGMIFLFDERRDHSFWMENTCIPLDMLFIDDDGLIVGIEENVPTMNRSTRQVGCASRYVLEVNAGWTRKNGVKAGQHVDLQGI